MEPAAPNPGDQVAFVVWKVVFRELGKNTRVG